MNKPASPPETGPSERDQARAQLEQWRAQLRKNPFIENRDYQHTLKLYFGDDYARKHEECSALGAQIPELEELVAENNLRYNLPRFEPYDGIGNRIDSVVHHPNYARAGNIIYSSRMMEKLARAGGLLDALSLFYLTMHAGEAGHNCPVACTAGVIRVLQKADTVPRREFYLRMLTVPSYDENYTGAQFLTEIQGGSDVGRNATRAYPDTQGGFRIEGEKWFCSNVDAELFLLTARYDATVPGTKGLGLFLIPAQLEDGSSNHYRIRRLKEKIGTASMASGEIDFEGAAAWHAGPLDAGFKMVMEQVLHLSRLFNSVGSCGLIKRAYDIAASYTRYREAFGAPIANYPLVQENLAAIRSDHAALLAAIFATVQLQDRLELSGEDEKNAKLLLRLLANLNKYVSALWGVDAVHHCIDMLGGNGAIESFSSLPRLLRDSIVFENWEGTHNTLRMQTLRDIERFELDRLFLAHIDAQLRSANAPSELTAPITAARDRLETVLAQLRRVDADLKSLVVKEVFDSMAGLLCGVALLNEALHQQRTEGRDAKLWQWRYFARRRLAAAPMKYDRAYLGLIARVVSE